MAKERFAKTLLLSLTAASVFSCSSSKATPLWNDKKVANQTVSLVVSDLHLGIDDGFAEDVSNRASLANFFKRIKTTANVNEVIIDGDFLDGWFLPFSYGPIHDYKTFYKKIAENNKDVISAINDLITNSSVKVIYVPGNHDMNLSRDILDSICPGIQQARDTEGLGTYRTGMRQEIVIEHGHRYNVFCAPDSLSDLDIRNTASILPPGYFYTRIATTSLMQKRPKWGFTFPDFGLPDNPSADVQEAYLYYKVFTAAIANIGITGMTFEDKVIPCGIDGYADYYALSDLVPLYRNGALTKTLFSGLGSRWDALQALNRVNAPMSFHDAVLESAVLSGTDDKAKTQYFDLDKSVDVVVFGHTHVPMLQKYDDGKVYLNSGTWIDDNLNSKNTRTFLKITSKTAGNDVALYTYNLDDTVTKLA
jgi:UDP-2,3-diacylglucosamine pyrophosphatase LpxH